MNQRNSEVLVQYALNQAPAIVAYCPWYNVTLERIKREIIAAMRALLAEFKLGPQDWPAVLSMIQTALNEAPLVRIGKSENGRKRTQLEAMNSF